MKRVNVEVWSDFACPWCWIAKRRLEKASNSLGGEIEVAVSHKAYRLARGMEAEDFKIALFNKFGSRVAAMSMMEAVATYGASEGLTYNFDTMRFGDTTDAHVLVKSIEPGENRDRLIEAIFAASTTEGRNIYDRDVLRAIAVGVGLNSEIDFDDTGRVSEVYSDEMALNAVGSGVPMFVFNRKSYLSGAREVATFERALLNAAMEASVMEDDSDAMNCGIDECRI